MICFLLYAVSIIGAIIFIRGYIEYFKNSKRNKIIDSIRDKIRNNEIYCTECKYCKYSSYCMKDKEIIKDAINKYETYGKCRKINKNNDCNSFWPELNKIIK